MKRYLLIILFTVESSFLFSQVGNTWLQKTSMTGVSRFGAVAFVIDDKAYVGTGEDNSGNLLKDFWQYDGSTDTWLRIADLPGSARRYAVAFSANGKGYVGTGSDGSNRLSDFYCYDAATSSWSSIPDLGNGTALGRYGSAGFSINNKGYVVSGYDGTGMNNAETWMFDDSAMLWNRKADFINGIINISRRWSSGFSIGNNGYVCLGYQYNHYFENDLWEYSASANTWSRASSFPGDSRAAAVAFVIGSNAYAGTGYNYSYLNDFYSYNAGGDMWRPIAVFEGGLTSEAVGFSINGKGYVCSGQNAIAAKSELWEYTPDTLAGITENILFNHFMIYPNPSSGNFSVQSEIKEGQIEIFNLMGERIYFGKLNNEKLYLDKPEGIYFVKVNDGEKVFTEKLVIE